MLPAKYQMTIEQNIFVSKRNIVDYMWKSARLEGIGVTYPDTEAIFNGMTVQGVSVRDTIAVNNLKHAWQFVLENVSHPLDFAFVCKVNQLVGGDNLVYEAGNLRYADVSIGGTTWKPEMPDAERIQCEPADLQTIKGSTECAISTMLYCMRQQMFFDGNKRTSMLAANKVLIANGGGVISVPIEHQPEFTKLLVDFYETNRMEAIMRFVYDNCIDGIHFEKKQESEQRPSVQERLDAAKEQLDAAPSVSLAPGKSEHQNER